MKFVKTFKIRSEKDEGGCSLRGLRWFGNIFNRE